MTIPSNVSTASKSGGLRSGAFEPLKSILTAPRGALRGLRTADGHIVHIGTRPMPTPLLNTSLRRTQLKMARANCEGVLNMSGLEWTPKDTQTCHAPRIRAIRFIDQHQHWHRHQYAAPKSRVRCCCVRVARGHWLTVQCRRLSARERCTPRWFPRPSRHFSCPMSPCARLLLILSALTSTCLLSLRCIPPPSRALSLWLLLHPQRHSIRRQYSR